MNPEDHPNVQPEGNFLGVALFSESSFDKAKFIADLEAEAGFSISEKDETARQPSVLEFDLGDISVHVGFVEEIFAPEVIEMTTQANYTWPEAAAEAGKQKAHAAVSVSSRNPLQRKASAMLFVQTASALLKQQAAIGLYTSGTFFQPDLYLEFAQDIKKGILPVQNLVWILLFAGEDEGCVSAVTMGMPFLGHPEVMIKNFPIPPARARAFLLSVCAGVVENQKKIEPGRFDFLDLDGEKERSYTASIADPSEFPDGTIVLSL